LLPQKDELKLYGFHRFILLFYCSAPCLDGLGPYMWIWPQLMYSMGQRKAANC